MSLIVLLLVAGCNGPLTQADLRQYLDPDGDGYDLDEDCDDGNTAINPSAVEVCDGIDNNCMDGVDEQTSLDAITIYLDSDGDGYGDSSRPESGCSASAGYAGSGDDCDDQDAAGAEPLPGGLGAVSGKRGAGVAGKEEPLEVLGT